MIELSFFSKIVEFSIRVIIALRHTNRLDSLIASISLRGKIVEIYKSGPKSGKPIFETHYKHKYKKK